MTNQTPPPSPDGDAEWDGKEWQKKPPGDARWNGTQWLVKPLFGDVEWDGKKWQTKPPAPTPSRPSRDRTSDWITTLPDVPGYRTVRSFGLVTALDASSVWTAGEKGRTAMSKVLSNLWLAAEDAGANAIVGLQSSAFGAGGGITSVVGGDAVGVLLVGTAVEVVHNEVADDGAGDQDPDNDPEE